MTTQPLGPAAKCPMNLGEVDLFAPGAQEHWFDAYRILHAEAPIYHIPGGGETPGADAYILTKYEDISAVVRDPVRFVTGQNSGFQEHEMEVFEQSGFSSAAHAASTLRPTIEHHMQHRQQLTDPWVGAVGCNRHKDMIAEVANDLMDRWIDDGEVSFVPGFAKPLPQTVITRILGFPLEDMPMLREWEEAQVRRFVYGATHRSLLSPEEERRNAAILVQFQQYIQDRVTEKRRNPGDDMTSFLTTVRYGDEQRLLSDGEVISVVYGMHIGGNETTQYALTAQAMMLARDPALFAELKADRSKVRAFVEESLRLYAPTQGLSSRTVMEDVEIRGTKIPRGSLLHLRYGAGNRDEENFPKAGELDLDRPSIGRHLTFSQGPRICPGAGLSRLEQNIAINLWLDRIAEWELAPGRNDLAHQPGIMLGLLELHLQFQKA
ncbi:MAG: cytochrome P450 [Sphingomonadales bacterium]